MQSRTVERPLPRRPARPAAVVRLAAVLGLLALPVAPARASLPADCNADGQVSVNEIVLAVNIALGTNPLSVCPNADFDGGGFVTVVDLVQAVNAALGTGVMTRPMIRSIKVEGDNVVEIAGRGQPGTVISIDTRQAAFRNVQGAATPFGICAWYNGGNWLPLGNFTTVGADGTWTLGSIQRSVVPANEVENENDDGCDEQINNYGGRVTYFRINSSYGVDSPPTPEITYWRKRRDDQNHYLEVTVAGGHGIAAGVTDGPDIEPQSTGPGGAVLHRGGVDLVEFGIDTCNTRDLTCGQTYAIGGTEGALHMEERDWTECSVLGGCDGGRDREYLSVFSLAQAHKPGGSVLAVMKTRRDEDPITGPDINLNVHVSGGVDVGIELGFKKWFGLF